MNNSKNDFASERDALLEALRIADVECRFCVHRDNNPTDCTDYCYDCPNPCPCHTCTEQSNWKWCGFKEAAE